MCRIIKFSLVLVLFAVSACSPAVTLVTAQPDAATPTAAPAAVEKFSSAPVPNARIHFGRITVEDGLSQSTTMTILQDQLGFLWFGTEDGLNRYDGQKFKVFRPVTGDDTSISDVWICALEMDSNGALWVGTRQGGANRYDAASGHFIHYQHDEADPASLSNNYVRTIYADTQGRLWFGTNAGLDLYDPQRDNFVHVIPMDAAGFIVNSIIEDSNGLLWIGAQNGLWRYDPVNAALVSLALREFHPPIQDILVSADGSLWLASPRSGLLHYFPETTELVQYLPDQGISDLVVRQLLSGPSGTLWVGTADGLNLFDPQAETFTQYYNDPNVETSLSSNVIVSLYQDDSGILWIGTYGGGISTYDPLANKFVHYFHNPDDPTSLGNNLAFSLAPAADGVVYIGTYGSGVDRFDPVTETFTHFLNDIANPNSVRDDQVWSVMVDRDGKVWIGTSSGLDWLEPTTGKFTHIPSIGDKPNGLPGTAVYFLYQARDGGIWVGMDTGLARYDTAKDAFTYFNMTQEGFEQDDGAVITIIEDREGFIWAGTFSNGLVRFNPLEKTTKHFRRDPRNPGSLSNDSILSLHVDQNNILWVGTAGGGLNRYDAASETFTVFDETAGLPNNVVYGILEDDQGYFWLSTNLGLARFDPRTGTSRNFTTADGLQSNEFNMGAYAEDAAGRMYFGGIHGISMFTPEAINQNQYVPRVNLISLTQNGAPLDSGVQPELTKMITLEHPNNLFEFEFAGLSYSQSAKNQYAYMLQGVDKDWYYAETTRSGRYSNLPGGEYTLLLKAANADGVWSEAQSAVKVIVVPPFWQTLWFYLLIVVLLSAGSFSVYRMRVRSVERQKLELERQVAERTNEIQQLFEQTKELAILEERNRLARDLHDSAKQKAFAALAQLGAARSLAGSDGKKALKHMQEAETLVGEVIQEITFLILEIHPAALKEKGLAAVLREYVFEWSNRTGIAADLKIAGEERLPLEIEQTLYRASQEALANVARHAEAENVTLSLEIQPEKVTFVIRDDGCGFEQSTNHCGMGLRSIRERVENVGGDFDIASAPGHGTQLSILIPITA